jgi:glutamyl-tRNA synthetase
MTESKGNQEVRVRFAPSPTGYLHVGGARTAIFNWLYARHTGGRFVLRIEDTDVERSTKESEASLLEDLEWLGLDWDEGPGKAGEHGPYRQSERLALYRDAADDLITQGLAYPCFCPDELLTQKKEKAIKAGESPHYDGTCRGLSAGQIESNRKAKVPEVVRFIVPPEKISFNDLVRGEIEMDTAMVGDYVLVRSNGLPTYNFAAAHDDHQMNITHVLRGEEHLPNTLRQILVYRALGAEPPAFGHVPLILAENRSKLSKRHGASSVGELRDRGYLASAAVNYLVLLGWSHPEEKEFLAPAEMIESFTVERINKSAAVYDPTKLGWMNGLHIRDLSLDEWVKVASAYLPETICRRYDQKEQDEILDVLRNNVEVMEDLAQLTSVFHDEIVYEEEAEKVLAEDSAGRVLAALKCELEKVGAGDWSPVSAKAAIKAAGKEAGVKGKELFFPVRAAVTGALHGPDLARVIALKGRDVTGALIDRAMGENK